MPIFAHKYQLGTSYVNTKIFGEHLIVELLKGWNLTQAWTNVVPIPNLAWPLTGLSPKCWRVHSFTRGAAAPLAADGVVRLFCWPIWIVSGRHSVLNRPSVRVILGGWAAMCAFLAGWSIWAFMWNFVKKNSTEQRLKLEFFEINFHQFWSLMEKVYRCSVAHSGQIFQKCGDKPFFFKIFFKIIKLIFFC